MHILQEQIGDICAFLGTCPSHHEHGYFIGMPRLLFSGLEAHRSLRVWELQEKDQGHQVTTDHQDPQLLIDCAGEILSHHVQEVERQSGL